MICNWKVLREYPHQLSHSGAEPEKEGMLSRRSAESGQRGEWNPGLGPHTPIGWGVGVGEGWSVSTGLNLLPGAPETPVLGPFPHQPPLIPYPCIQN